MLKNKLNSTFAANMAQPRSRTRDLSRLFSAPVNFGDTNRDDSKSYGYPDALTFDLMYNAYNRGGFFKAVVDIVPERCFSEHPTVIDGADEDTEQDSAFEVAFKEFARKYDFWRVMREAFKQSRLGNYSTIVPIFTETSADAKLTDELTSARNVLAINPFYQTQCHGATEYVSDYFDKDWNKPKWYELYPSALSDSQSTNAEQRNLHRSRVFVVTNAVGAQIEGTPALEAPFNALFDCNKIRGASAEGYRKNAKQRTVMSANDPKAAQAMSAKKEEIDQAIDDFENGVNNYLKLAGSSVSSLQSDLADPTGAFTIAMQEACAAQRIPVTELIGFMTGERSSTENSSAFNKRLRSEQNNEYGPTIIKFLQWLVDLGVLPQPNDEITIKWPDISEPTKSEKLANAKSMIEQNKLAYESQEEEPWTTEEIREAAGADKEKPRSEYETLEPKSELTLDDMTDENQAD